MSAMLLKVGLGPVAVRANRTADVLACRYVSGSRPGQWTDRGRRRMTPGRQEQRSRCGRTGNQQATQEKTVANPLHGEVPPPLPPILCLERRMAWAPCIACAISGSLGSSVAARTRAAYA